jgi:hypothetical protein
VDAYGSEEKAMSWYYYLEGRLSFPFQARCSVNFVQRLDPSRDAEAIRRLLTAPNAVPVRKHDGDLVGIRLLSMGDDRGHSGERHGRSTVTTERVRNDNGVYIGWDRNVKHKGRLGPEPVRGEGRLCATPPPSN